MNFFDIAVLALLALATLGGIRQGFVYQIATILGALVALSVARLEYTDVRGFLERVASQSQWLTVISYLIVFLAVWGAIMLVARRARAFVGRLKLGGLDRLGGGVIGFLQGILLVELLIYLTDHLSNRELRLAEKHSALAPTLGQVVPLLHQLFPHVQG